MVLKPRPSDPDQALVCVVLGDVVGSRRAGDRRRLHDALVAALDEVNTAVPSVRPLRVTVGDEFQGVYATLGAALDAAFRVRVALLPQVDTRFGVGRGPTEVLDADAGLEDGPAWWAARAAIEDVEADAARGALRLVRTRFLDAAATPDADPLGAPAITAALDCRDHLVGSLSHRSLRLLRGLMDPTTTQADLATAEGVSPSAISQRVRTDGIGVVLAARSQLAGLP